MDKTKSEALFHIVDFIENYTYPSIGGTPYEMSLWKLSKEEFIAQLKELIDRYDEKEEDNG